MIDRKIEQFRSGSFILTGQWDGPQGAFENGNSFPGVIFCHGFTGNRFESRRMFARLSAALAASGIVTFRFDHRGCGESEGDFRDFNADGLLEDLDSALAVFLTGPVDPAKTAVVGYSLGGLSGSYLLSRRPEFLTAVIWAGVAQPDIIRDRLATYPDFERYKTDGYFDYMGFRVSQGYIDNIGKLDPVAWSCTYRKGVFFIQGADDVIVKPRQAEIYMERRGVDNDRLLMVEGGDHFFGSADNIDNVLAESKTWLLNYLK